MLRSDRRHQLARRESGAVLRRLCRCVAGVLVWLALGVPSGFSGIWLTTGSAVMSVVIVVLVAVLENAERRSEQAIQQA
jgi:low affinity Fe/Cu permease